LEPKLALLKTKPKIKKAVTNNAILIDLYKKIQESKQQHQKIFNLSDIFTDPHFLISCYNQIKIKSGNMTPGISKENLDGIDHKSFFNIANDLKSGKFRSLEIGSPPFQMGQIGPVVGKEKIVQKALERILSAI
jgi:hypothetical protein